MKEVTHHMAYYNYDANKRFNSRTLCSLNWPSFLMSIENPEEEVTCEECKEILAIIIVEEL